MNSSSQNMFPSEFIYFRDIDFDPMYFTGIIDFQCDVQNLIYLTMHNIMTQNFISWFLFNDFFPKIFSFFSEPKLSRSSGELGVNCCRKGNAKSLYHVKCSPGEEGDARNRNAREDKPIQIIINIRKLKYWATHCILILYGKQNYVTNYFRCKHENSALVLLKYPMTRVINKENVQHVSIIKLWKTRNWK